MDPFYSPGMDWISFTVFAASELVLAERAGVDLEAHLAKHNQDFRRSYRCWFEALYLDKYEYIGDFELMRLAFLLDLGLYYLGVASQPFKFGAKALRKPVFSVPISRPFFHLMRLYNRRFARIARVRRSRKRWGSQNVGRRFLFQGYTFAPASAFPILKAIAAWMLLEATEGWRSWFQRTTGSSLNVPTSKSALAGTPVIQPSTASHS
jgi:hypothetical protein